MAEAGYLSFYLSTDTVYVFRGVLQRIGCPAYVRFLVNPDTMQLVMEPYHQKEFTSFRVPKGLYKEPTESPAGFRVRSRAFCRLLAARLSWDADKSYRIPGVVYPNRAIAHFDLFKAREINTECQ